MPAQTQDDDFLAAMPDTSRTGKPYKASAAAKNDDFLSAMPDSSAKPDLSYLTANTKREGLYRMMLQDKPGHADASRMIRVPFSKVEAAQAAGYDLHQDEVPRYAKDYEYAGLTAAQGGPGRRFLQSAANAIKGPVVGAYHAVSDAPQAGAELATESMLGRPGVIAKRMIVDPHIAEWRKSAEEYKAQAHPWSLTPSREDLRHGALAVGHGLATIVPVIGPAAAGVGEQIGTQFHSADVAGGLGTAAGNAALYAAPKGLGKLAKSELVSQTAPRWIVRRMIRPMEADVKFGKDPVQAILEEGITGNRLEDIGPRVANKMNEVGKEIDAEALKPANASKIVDLSGALKPLDDAMAEAVKAGDRKLFRRLYDKKTELMNDWQQRVTKTGKPVRGMKRTGLRNMQMSPYDALAFKRMIGRRIRWTDNALDGEVNGTLADVYGNVKDELDKNMGTDFQNLNRRYGNLFAASKSIERRLPVEQRQAFASLIDIGLGASGHFPAAVASYVGKLPAVRTRGAKLLYNLPRAAPDRPTAITAPVIGAGQSAQRLRELRDQAEKQRPQASTARVAAGATY